MGLAKPSTKIHKFVDVTLLGTNIAMENPPFLMVFTRKDGDVHGLCWFQGEYFVERRKKPGVFFSYRCFFCWIGEHFFVSGLYC